MAQELKLQKRRERRNEEIGGGSAMWMEAGLTADTINGHRNEEEKGTFIIY